MARFIIQGGKRLSGCHRPAGNKNAALPMLAACVLTDQPVRLQNVPQIQDVQTMLAILEDLGAEVSVHRHTVEVCCANLRKYRLDPALCARVRSSILFAGPLTMRMGRAILHAPGGDVIGRRPLDTHFNALREMGIQISENRPYRLSRGSVRADGNRSRILLEEASVTATENLVMAAVLRPGPTTIFNAACEPHVQDLCHMLNRMGANISGIGTNYLRIDGVAQLRGVTHRVSPDYIETGSFIAAAAVTGGSLTIEDTPAEQLDVITRPFRKLGVDWTVEDTTLKLSRSPDLRVRNDMGAAVPKIEDGIWPSFPSDLMSVAIVVATQANGTMLFFEKLFESRMYFVDRLIEMGARIVQCDPHRVIVSGPSRLHGTHLSSPDIRAGMAMLVAALCAEGRSVIENAQCIDRGYEQIEQRLRKLGADIRREK